MIKFFRHIRKSLLEQNNMGKYFKYAIGEILLVVIGILIALQINNWNENRKDQKLLENYYQQLLEELKLDVNAIQFSIARLENDRKQFKTITKKLSEPNLDLDTILKIYDKADFIIDNSSFNTKTIDVLLSTGDIKLIQSKIKNALLTLQNEQLDHIRDSNSRQESYVQTFERLTYLLPLNKKLLNEQKSLSNYVNAKHKMIQEIPILNSAIISRDRSNKFDLLELNNIFNLTKELQRFIKAELNK